MLNLYDALIAGTKVTFLGMGIVFIVLTLLWGILELFRIVFEILSKKKVLAQPEALKTEQAISIDNNDSEQIVAVLTAAVAMFLDTAPSGINIRSFRRIGDRSPVWNSVSKKEQMNSAIKIWRTDI